MEFAAHNRDQSQVSQKEWVRLRRLNPQRIVVSPLDLGDVIHIGDERSRADLDRRYPLDRENDVVGGEGRAVVKGHVVAQAEFPCRLIDQAPGERQLGQVLGGIVRCRYHQPVV
jgi:hypothetical protein